MPTTIDPNSWLYSFVELCLILVVGVLSLTSKQEVIDLPLSTVAAAETPNMPTTRPAVESVSITVTPDKEAPDGLLFRLVFDDATGAPEKRRERSATTSDVVDKLGDLLLPGFNGRIIIRPTQTQSVQDFVSLWSAVRKQCMRVKAKCEIGLQARPLNARDLERSERLAPAARPN